MSSSREAGNGFIVISSKVMLSNEKGLTIVVVGGVRIAVLTLVSIGDQVELIKLG